jgi:hypothetical protein
MITSLPENFNPEQFFNTIKGIKDEKGDLGLLERRLDYIKAENGLYQLSNVLFAHWAVKEEQFVEFDVYGLRDVHENTKIRGQSYGLLLTPLVLSGYSASSGINVERHQKFIKKWITNHLDKI